MKIRQEKFAKAFLQNGLPMGLTTQREGCFVEVNDAFLKASGFQRNEVIGNTVTSLGLVTDEQRTMALDKLNKRGRVENLELQIKTKNGTSLNGLLNMILMTLGRDKYRLIVLTDITDFKREGDIRRTGTPLTCMPIDSPMPWFIN